MGNENRVRFRQDEAAYGQRSATDRSPADDPLAELARLIGQEDPFAEFFRENDEAAASRQAASPAPRAAQPAPRAPARPTLPELPQPPARPQAPGPFSALAAEVYADPTHRSSEGQRHTLQDAARDANRSFIEPEPVRPAPRERSYGAPLDSGYVPEPAPRARPVERPRDPRASDRAAEAVAEALGQSFDFSPAPAPAPQSRDTARFEAEPRAARPAHAVPRERAASVESLDIGANAYVPPQQPSLREPPLGRETSAPREEDRFALQASKRDQDDAAYDYGRSAVEHDGYEDEADDFDEQYDAYEEERPARGRRRLLLIGAVLGVAVLGTAGVYGYRALSSGGGSVASGQPPVIRAAEGPTKVTPAQPATEQASDGQKLIYDRVGSDAGAGNERVVSREEQPIDVSQAAQPQPRVILPATGSRAPTPSSPAPLGAMPSDPSSVPAPTASNSTEPKRVRTLTVRADGTVVDTPTAPAPIPVRSAQAPAPSAPSQISAYAPDTTASTPANVPLPPSRVAAAPAPLAAAPAPAPAAPAASAASTGGYVVQVAAQRSQADAQTAWRATQSKYPGILGSYSANIKRADLGDRGIYYRAQVGPFASKDQANELCQSLRAQGGDCMVQKN